MKRIKGIIKNIKWLFNYITCVIMYAIIFLLILIGIVILLYYIDIKKRENSNVWEPPLYGAYVIVSESMTPIIKKNDAILIKRVDANEIKIGDVITYKSEDATHYGIMITHRVVSMVNDDMGEISFVTKGDNNNVADKTPVKESNIYGKVIMRIPKIGYVQYFLATSYGWIIAIAIPCMGIIIYDVMKLFKSFSKRKKISYEK